jgi:uncharacterized membrane protein YphA (DoxX/SURF4 family)
MGDGMSAVAVWSVALVATCAGAALLLGLLTTVAAALVSVGTIAIAFGWIPWSLARPIDVGVSTVFFVSMGVAIALLGPGAVSVDARLRGRREIVIPGNTRRTDR